MTPTLNAINKWDRRQFNYGDADCCQFTAFIVKQLTGRDYARQFAYSNKVEADALISAKGDLRDFAQSILGEPTGGLKTGDPVIMRVPTIGLAMGILLGDKIVSVCERGLIRVDKRYLVCGWAL
tara:strand:+ start:2818 stop:3189 length:372 start_codon:yes stop_codon:yes gene_type:complete